MKSTFSSAHSDTTAQPSATWAPVTQAIVNLCSRGAQLKVGGIPLAARFLHHLNAIGITEVILLLPWGESLDGLEAWQGDLHLRRFPVPPQQPDPASAIPVVPQLQDRFLYFDGAHLIDPRIIRTLAESDAVTLAFMDGDDPDQGKIRAALLDHAAVTTWRGHGAQALIRSSEVLLPHEMDPAAPEIRGESIPYFMEIDSADAARLATKRLISSQQKQVMDLPAEYLDPPLENALTYLLCRTPITPNMVTFLGVAVAALVAWLFWHGHFAVGAVIAFAVEILDGVDGKLARTKLQFSKLGEQESVIDYFCENSWYAALGAGLSPLTAGHFPLLLAATLILADTADNIFYTLANSWYDSNIDLWSPFDRKFRRIAGRRNIYGAMFIFGFLLGYPLQTFAVAALWGALTAAIHGIRLLQYGHAAKRLAAARKVTE